MVENEQQREITEKLIERLTARIEELQHQHPTTLLYITQVESFIVIRDDYQGQVDRYVAHRQAYGEADAQADAQAQAWVDEIVRRAGATQPPSFTSALWNSAFIRATCLYLHLHTITPQQLAEEDWYDILLQTRREATRVLRQQENSW